MCKNVSDLSIYLLCFVSFLSFFGHFCFLRINGPSVYAYAYYVIGVQAQEHPFFTFFTPDWSARLCMA